MTDKRLLRVFCVLSVLLLITMFAEKAFSLPTKTYNLKLISLQMPGSSAPTDARVRKEAESVVKLWKEFVVINLSIDIIHIKGTTTQMTGTQFNADLPEKSSDDIQFIVTNAHTMGCYTQPGRIFINGYGDCAPHEFGHILGLEHSKAFDSVVGELTYGDLHSVMGSGHGSATYAQLNFLGLAPQPMKPANHMVLRSMSLQARSSVSWGKCWIDYRRDKVGTELSGYTSDDGRETMVQVIIKPGTTKTFCGKRVSLNRSPTGIARITIKES